MSRYMVLPQLFSIHIIHTFYWTNSRQSDFSRKMNPLIVNIYIDIYLCPDSIKDEDTTITILKVSK